jgi:hypothetical protein
MPFRGNFHIAQLEFGDCGPPAVHPTTEEPLVIDCLRGTPDAIDGDLSDWNLEAMTPAVLDAQEQLSGDSANTASWDSPEDSSGEFYLLWDDVNIYIAVVMKDDKLSMNKTGGDIWNADCIEVFFSTTDAIATHTSTIHYQYGFNANNQTWNWCNMDTGGGIAIDYLQVATTITADGYICEAAIPYGQMLSLDFSEGNTIGFHPVLDDTDDGDRELQMSWTGLAAHDQSQGFGHMFLSSTALVPQAESSNPNPRDGAKGVPQEVVLKWRQGDYVEGLSPKHRVFFSENFDDVNDGIGGIEQDVEHYPTDEYLRLDLGKTYYWRVDESNSTSGWDIGALWRFTVIDYLVVDNFEQYTDYPPDDIFSMWKDGYGVDENGALIGYDAPDIDAGEHFIETSIVNNGKQSMPYFYNNIGAVTFSEAHCMFSPGQDWTREGVEILTIWFKGYPAYVGSFVEAPAGTYTMTGSGVDIWDTADEFHFAFKEFTGAGTIIAKVESVQNTHGFAKAGVMIRDTLDADSRYTGVFITPENGVRFQYRNTAGGVTDRQFVEGITAPQWVKLERTSGGLVRAYYSADGTTWERFNLTQVMMNTPMYIGLGVTSHDAALTCEAKFSNVSFPGTNVDMQWTDQDVGMLSNEPEPMYVTVGDGSGTASTVYYDDPNASLITDWTEWNIPLTDFSDRGVVLTDIGKLAIGFGSADNPQPGGSGLVFLDDIRLYLPREVAEE